jgi:hypothetical protein
MIVDNFNVVRITLAETEAYPPGPVDGHSPLPLTVSLELVKANAPQRTEILEACRGVKGSQQLLGCIAIHPAEL